MANHEIRSLPIAVRVFPDSGNAERDIRSEKPWRIPEGTLVFDTETRFDATQKLTFGSYRFIVAGQCQEEGLFYGDDLPKADLRVLQEYAAHQPAQTVPGGVEQLRLLTRREFLKLFYDLAYEARCLVVGFNLPFDLSRLAFDFAPARGFFAGGFSLGLWSYRDPAGRERPNGFRPRVCIKYIDSKRALIGFTARNSPDQADLIPEGSVSGEPKPGYKFPGHFLDLRTIAFALTDEAYSLEGACEAFGVEHGKQRAARHGVISAEYIDYNRRDVLATSELALKLIDELVQHPIALPPTFAFSPASIGKGYLRAMGIEPILKRQPTFPKEYIGYAQSAFFGGRTSVHIRKVVCPVVYTDFLSMYSTVNSLMSLWRFVIAREIQVVEHCNQQVDSFLRGLTPDALFEPKTWRHMAGFVKVIPSGDILPIRSKYSAASNDWQVSINHVYAKQEDALWYSIPDVVASVLLTGRVPEIVDAFLIEPRGKLSGLRSTKLRGTVEVDPAHEDFFRVVVEERLRLSSRRGHSKVESKRLEKALKVLANATSYGIYAQMDRQEDDEKLDLTCHGIDVEPFACNVAHPDLPGEFCFPPLASLITGGARLMVALLEHCVSELGGTYVMEDTDSMAIVATEHGGLVRCPGGPFEMKDGHTAVTALSLQQVNNLSARFTKLSPYRNKSRSILKIERDNFDPATGRQRQVYCLAISAKRYSLFLLDEGGNPILLQKGVNNHEDRWSEHGLGHLRSPSGFESEDRDWIPQAWHSIICTALALPTQPLSFEHLPAIGRVTITRPTVMRSLARLNLGKKYGDRLKPFNFLLSCHVKQFGHPPGTDPEKISPCCALRIRFDALG
jgi:hypothetical protein